MKDKTHVLVVEDDQQQRELLVSILTNAQFQVTKADSCEAAIVELKKNNVELVFSDWKLPGLTGLELLNYVRREQPNLGFVMATAHGTINHAVEAMQAGSDDYLAKPFQRQELLMALEKAKRASQLRNSNKHLKEALGSQQKLVNLISVSASMQKVHSRISKVAPTSATVLITGESGTGKELVARSIHDLSNRQQHRFVAINCGAIPKDLAEAELFGAKKGAYTSAVNDKEGKFSYAHNGTLFLDEIAELPLALQAKLLRFLQEGTITPLGDNKEQQLDVRVIAATHRNLPEMVAAGQFREDLYYRLNIVPIDVPPLRKRKEDIAVLAEFFFRKCCKQYSISGIEFSNSAMEKLNHYDWPGNVRELSNRIERFVLLNDVDELIVAQDTSGANYQSDFELPERGIDFEQLEYSLLRQALEQAGGNRTQAAKLLTMSYKAFLYRIEKHKLG